MPRLSFRAESRNLSIVFPILPLGHSRTITAAWRFFFAALNLEHDAFGVFADIATAPDGKDAPC